MRRNDTHFGHAKQNAFKRSFLAISVSIVTACSSTGEEPLEDDPVLICENAKPRPVMEDGQPFKSLDGYLKFRKSQGAFDRPFYQKLEDGRYKLNRGRGERFAEPVFFTREELATKYGFQCP